MKLNTPNKLTLSRMIITILYLFIFTAEFIPHRYLIGLIVYAVGAFTDFLDGRLARKNNQITVVGKLLDPVADKMLTTTALLVFMKMGLCNIWIVVIVLTREFAITSLRLVASAQGTVIPANIWGKLKTATQMVFTLVIMVLIWISEDFVSIAHLPLISNILLGITAVLAAVSGVIYIIDSINVVDFSK
ncbi:MAG: CDP-diacylglycerol--glycerol-3-phosphate 3-phosphatidyltransferase [Clostridiales bacterium]|nr:CDP-diacylglycerol--glycerol-3-phosphate 3-phosphatidyltransferase [Clostridiales bacterium]